MYSSSFDFLKTCLQAIGYGADFFYKPSCFFEVSFYECEADANDLTLPITATPLTCAA